MNHHLRESSPARPWGDLGLAALLMVVTLILYWPATRCDFVNYDDPDYVTANPRVQAGLSLDNVGWAFTTGQGSNWQPLTWLSLMLDAGLFGTKAAGFHFTNLVLHAVNVVLLFWLLLRLTGARWRSAAVAALFGWHPLHVESVAWVSERKDVLSTCLGFLSLLFYVRFAQRRAAENREPMVEQPGGDRAFCFYPEYWLAWCGFAGGLMSKPMLVTWPFVLLLLDYWPLGRFRSGRGWPLVREKMPFLALTVAASVVTLVVQKQGGAVVVEGGLSLGARVGNALISYCRYLEKIFCPADLAVFYPHPGNWPVEHVLVAGASLAGLTVLAWRQRRRFPFVMAGWFWFLGTLVPVIGFVQAGSQAMADRYTYIPSVGVLILAVWGAHEMTQRWRHQTLVLASSGAVAVVLCLAVTRSQLAYWQDSETLFRHALAVTQNNYVAHNNLGNFLSDRGQTDEAIQEFQTALRLKPDYAGAHYNLGVVLAAQGQIDGALNQFQETVRLQPDDAIAHNSLGILLGGQGRMSEAISQFQDAIRLKSDYAPAHCDLGAALLNEDQTDAAISQFQEALRLKPHYAVAQNDLARALSLSSNSPPGPAKP